VGWRDLRTVADRGGGDFPFEPGVNGVGYEAGDLFGGTMADAGEGDEVRVLKVAAQFRRGVKGDGAIAIAPEDESWGIEVVAKRAA
jgi:hypothetical protein